MQSISGKPDLKRDLKIGKKAEKKIHPQLEELFGKKLISTDSFNQFCNFDFVNENKDIWIEHKNRTNYSSNFNTYFFDEVKLIKFKKLKEDNPKVRAFIVWSFKDCRKIWEITDSDKMENGHLHYYIENQFADRGRGYKVHTDVVNVFNERTTKLNDYVFTEKTE